MKDRNELEWEYKSYSNNYLKMHGYSMFRRGRRRKKSSLREQLSVPFPSNNSLRKGRRVRFGK